MESHLKIYEHWMMNMLFIEYKFLHDFFSIHHVCIQYISNIAGDQIFIVEGIRDLSLCVWC